MGGWFRGWKLFGVLVLAQGVLSYVPGWEPLMIPVTASSAFGYLISLFLFKRPDASILKMLWHMQMRFPATSPLWYPEGYYRKGYAKYARWPVYVVGPYLLFVIIRSLYWAIPHIPSLWSN